MTDAGALLKSVAGSVRAQLSLALVAAAAGALLGVALAYVLAGAIDAVVFHGANLAASAGALLALATLAAARAGLAYMSDIAGFEAAVRARRILFARLVDQVFALGPTQIADLATGDLVATLTEAVSAIEPYFRRWLPTLATVAVVPLAILVVVLPLDWESGLVFLCGLPLLLVFMILVGKGAEQASSEQWASLARLGGHLLDAVQGLRDLKLFGAAEREIAVVRASADGYRRETMKVLRIAFLSALVLEFFATVSIAFVAILIGFRLLSSEIDFRTGFFILLLAPQFYAPLRAMGADRHARMEAVAAAERMIALLNRSAPPRPAIAGVADAGAVAVRIDNVSVSYGEREALRELSLEIAPGEHVALVGASGAGKSTLFAALLGFVAPSAGRILIDAIDLAAPGAARPPIAYVPQRAHLFGESVAGNIALGRAGDVGAALDAARAGFVGAMPEGAATRVGEGGRGVSGGELQRLSVARALFAPAPLILFDEPSAHLDEETERAVGAAIADFARGRTMITIAHRLATIRGADRIVVLDRGRIVEQGTHGELAARDGHYAHMLGALAGDDA